MTAKKYIVGLVLALVSVSLVACGPVQEKKPEQKARQYTQEQQQEIQRQIGQPSIDEFFEKRLAKQIYELRDNSELTTYAYNVNLDGKYVYIGKAVGFGLPYSTQYTTPEKIVDGEERLGYNLHSSDGIRKLPQPEPNGLYTPDGMSATWLMLQKDNGEREIVYTEPELVVTQSKMPKRLVADWSLPDDY